MRKITASFFMSLDGVVDEPHKWHFPYMDQEAQAASGAALATTDTILLGRATYEEWPWSSAAGATCSRTVVSRVDWSSSSRRRSAPAC